MTNPDRSVKFLDQMPPETIHEGAGVIVWLILALIFGLGVLVGVML